MLSCVWFCDPWAVACQVPLSMELSRQEYWSGLPFPPPEYLPNPGIILKSLVPPTSTGRFFATRLFGKTLIFFKIYFNRRLITLQHCVVFAIHSCEPATGVLCSLLTFHSLLGLLWVIRTFYDKNSHQGETNMKIFWPLVNSSFHKSKCCLWWHVNLRKEK